MKLSRNIELLKEGCRRWEEVVNVFRKLGLYDERDAKNLSCTVSEKGWAELTLESTSGKRAKVNLNEMKLEYYDIDRSVQDVMEELFRDVGAKCEVHKGEGVFCDIRNADIPELFSRLGVATSMDRRLDDPDKFWATAILRDKDHTYTSLDYLCSECGGTGSAMDFEFCAVKTILDLLG